MDRQSPATGEFRRQDQPLARESRKPQRVSITIPWGLYQNLLSVSDQQGRSLSNLACYWLERQAALHARTDQL